MANEIQVSFERSKTVYAIVRNQTSGFVWSVTSGYMESFVSGNWGDYAISLTEQAATSFYQGDFPSAISPGIYSVLAKEQVGGSEEQTDPTVGTGDIHWNGSKVNPLSDLVTSGQIGQIAPIRLARGVMARNFPIYLKSAADHVTPMTSGIVSGQISRDGGAFGALQSGAITEVGLGFYNLQSLTSGDLLANTVALLFTATGISGGTSDPLAIGAVLQKVSGQ